MWMVLFIYYLYILTVTMYVLKWYPTHVGAFGTGSVLFLYLLLAFPDIGFQPNASSPVLPGQAASIEGNTRHFLPGKYSLPASRPSLFHQNSCSVAAEHGKVYPAKE